MTPIEHAKLKFIAASLDNILRDAPPSLLVSRLRIVHGDLAAMAGPSSNARRLWFLGIGRYEDRPTVATGIHGGAYPLTGQDKIGAIKLVREVATTIGLAEAKALVEGPPFNLGPLDPSRSAVQRLLTEHKCEWRDA